MINTEPHKRIPIPIRADYIGFTTMRNGKFIFKTNSGHILYEFDDEEDCILKSNSIGDALHKLYRIKQVEYEIHFRNNPQYYWPTYEEANWVHKALYKGFKNRAWGNSFINPYDGWFGCNVGAYKDKSPDIELFRDEKVITLSLQGMYAKPINKYKELWDNRSIKYSCFMDGQNILHENWVGGLPTIEFIENFIQ